ncbi:hypothetical protein Sjap_008421 [Stephania japonica]|uniref:Uncharacterized protein n=1 Tax=Stephania japonica TaxID=461633 RepID=A0AAP0PBB9_9MAGN
MKESEERVTNNKTKRGGREGTGRGRPTAREREREREGERGVVGSDGWRT